MRYYIARRIAGLIPVLLGVSVLVFFLMSVLPGNVARVIIGPFGNQDAVAAINKQLGLDQPIYLRYWHWLVHAIQGDFGLSVTTQTSVTTLLLPRIENTLILATASLILAVIFGVLVGLVAASFRSSRAGEVLLQSTIFASSIPVFYLGLVLILIFSIKVNVLPATGMHSATGSGIVDLLKHLVLPAISTAALPAAIIARMVRASMIEILNQDYIQNLRARGIAERRIIIVHGFRNALPPFVTITGLQLGYLLGGALFTEIVFAWPGLGLQLYQSISSRDYPVVQAAALTVAVLFVAVNLIVDLIHHALDPRLRTS